MPAYVAINPRVLDGHRNLCRNGSIRRCKSCTSRKAALTKDAPTLPLEQVAFPMGHLCITTCKSAKEGPSWSPQVEVDSWTWENVGRGWSEVLVAAPLKFPHAHGRMGDNWNGKGAACAIGLHCHKSF